MKRISIFILSLCMVFSAVSCEKTNKSSGRENAPAQKTELSVSDADYHLKELTTPYESGDALAAAPLAEGRYIAAFRSAENIVPEFFTVGEDFDKYTVCNTGMEFRDNAEIFVRFACDSDGTVYAAVTEITHGDYPPYNYLDTERNPEDFDRAAYDSCAEYFHTIYEFNAEGKIVSEAEITGLDKAEIQDLAIYGESFYIWCGSMYSVGKSGGNAEEYSRSGFEVWGNLGVASGGEFICQGNSGKNSCLLIGDRVLSLSESGDPVSHIFAGGSSFDAVFASKTGIYGLNGNTLTQLALNIKLGIDENSVEDVFPVQEGYILRVFDQVDLCCRLYRMTNVPEENASDEPVVLKLGVLYQTDDFSSHTASFNRSGKNITIEPVYYSEYDVYDKEKKEQVNTGLGQLQMDILAGDGPDLAVFMNTPPELKNKGAFADMYNLMDNELSSDMILPNVLEACGYNGKLYSLPVSFSVRSMAAKKKFSDVHNQTFEELVELSDRAAEGMLLQNNCPGSEVFNDLLWNSDYALSFIDGHYAVDEEHMKNLLEYCMRYPSEYSEEMYSLGNDEVLMTQFAAEKFSDFKTCYDMFGEPVSFIGYPSESGIGNVMQTTCNVAVMENCDDKKAAWEFVKSIYIGNNSSIVNSVNMGFPIIKKDFDALVDAAESSGSFTESELEQAVETITGARRLCNGTSVDLSAIFWEESEAYFAGESTAEEAAAYIKNRTDIYISENE